MRIGANNTSGERNISNGYATGTNKKTYTAEQSAATAQNWHNFVNRNNNTGGGGGYSGGGSSGSSESTASASSGYNMSDIIAQWQAQQQAAAKAAMDAANKQIDAQLSSSLSNYEKQRKDAESDYSDAINQSELNKFWAKKNLRETQADRGLLDSGAGRQDNLYLDTNYNNNLTKIQNARADTLSDIETAINYARQQAEIAKASNYANYQNSASSGMISMLSNLLSGYDGNLSDVISALASFSSLPTNSVQNSSPTMSNYLSLYGDDGTDYSSKYKQKYSY